MSYFSCSSDHFFPVQNDKKINYNKINLYIKNKELDN